MRILYLALSLFLVSNSAFADTLIMPRELVELAAEAGCVPNNDSFDRPGYVDPPYLYGYAPGTGMVTGLNKPRAVVFWCVTTGGEGYTESLLVFGRKSHDWHGFSLADSAKQLPCPNLIRWKWTANGLSVHPPDLPLDLFHYLDDPKQKGPKGVMPSHEILRSMYDGTGSDFYCHNGRWMVAARD